MCVCMYVCVCVCVLTAADTHTLCLPVGQFEPCEGLRSVRFEEDGDDVVVAAVVRSPPPTPRAEGVVR